MSSPCIGVCRIEGGLCVGCGRTVEQIMAAGSLAIPPRCPACGGALREEHGHMRCTRCMTITEGCCEGAPTDETAQSG